MSASSVIDRQHGEQSGFISANGVNLFLRVWGTTRESNPTAPAVVIEHGLGGTSSEWVAVVRLVSRFARVYAYERAGYYPSERPTSPPTPAAIAANLKGLLSNAGVDPPYILVGHSYGGVLIRQFLADYGSEVEIAGMVIVDSAPEVTKMPSSWSTLLGDSTYEAVVGLDANHCLSATEYQTMKDESSRNEGDGSIAAAEVDAWGDNVRNLRERLRNKQALGSAPLSVIFCDESKDFGKAYDYGIRHGNGTKDAQEALRVRLEDMSEVDEAAMREHLALSSNSRFVRAQGKAQTHNSQIVEPSFVAGEIEWVYHQSVREHQTL